MIALWCIEVVEFIIAVQQRAADADIEMHHFCILYMYFYVFVFIRTCISIAVHCTAQCGESSRRWHRDRAAPLASILCTSGSTNWWPWPIWCRGQMEHFEIWGFLSINKVSILICIFWGCDLDSAMDWRLIENRKEQIDANLFSLKSQHTINIQQI